MRTLPTRAGEALAACLLFVFLLGVAATSGADGHAIQIPTDVPYKDPTIIDSRITSECLELGPKLGRFLHEYADKYDVETVQVEKADPKAKGRVLVVEITSAISGGNAFIGHRKSMSAKAELFEDGVSKGNANYTRDSGGGFGGGYKGSCSVLGRCTKALGNDIAQWLRDREKGKD